MQEVLYCMTDAVATPVTKKCLYTPPNYGHREDSTLKLLLKYRYLSPEWRYTAPVDTSYFEGTGYGRVMITKTGNTILIGMFVFTRLENGLLLYMGNEVRVW